MFDRLTRSIATLSLWLAGVCMAAMAIMTVADVFMRYVYLSPLPGTGEHTQLLMAVIVFSGLVLVTREGTHIVVSLFEDPLNRMIPHLYDRIYVAANFAGLMLIIYAMYRAALEMFEYEEETLVMEYPLVYLGAFIVFLLFLAMVQLRHLAKHGPSGHNVDE